MAVQRPNDADATYQDLSLEMARKAQRISTLASGDGGLRHGDLQPRSRPSR